MPIKITETIERFCCEPKDLKKYEGAHNDEEPKNVKWFCQYCGQLWENHTYTDAAGSRDTELVKCGMHLIHKQAE